MKSVSMERRRAKPVGKHGYSISINYRAQERQCVQEGQDYCENYFNNSSRAAWS